MQCISECITVSGITCNLRKTLVENMFTQGHFVNAEIRIKAVLDIQQAPCCLMSIIDNCMIKIEITLMA